MEQPLAPNTPPSANPFSKPTKTKLPTPQDLISHYQSQGLDAEAASIKVIEDLQNVLYKVVSTANSKNKKDKLAAGTSRKLDVVNNRLAVVDMKLDSKPGYLEAFSLGVASGVAFKGIETIWPHVIDGVSQIWAAVSSATKPASPGH